MSGVYRDPAGFPCSLAVSADDFFVPVGEVFC